MIILEKEEDFKELIKNKKVVVDFFATWCGPCKMLGPVIEEVSKEHDDITFIKVDTDKFPNLAREYGIMSIPTIKVFENGNLTKSTVGFMDRGELEDFIK